MKRPFVSLAIATVAIAGVAVKVLEKEPAVAKWMLALPEIAEPLDVEDLVFTGGVGLVVGQRMPTDIKEGMLITEILPRAEAVILQLAPGAPEWRQVYSGRGEVFRISSVGQGVFYALGESFLRDESRVQFIEKSTDAGATWHPLPPPPEGIVGFRFTSTGRGWTWTKQTVFSTEDDGRSWREIVHLAEERLFLDDVEPVFDAKGGVWVPDGSRVLHVRGDERRVGQLPAPTRIYWLASAPDESIWVVSQLGENGPTRIYRIKPQGEPELLSELQLRRYLPERLHVGREVALLSGCDVGGGDESPTYFMLASRDGGRTWTREKPSKVATLSPIYFETDEIVWAYANFGRIQRRTPR